MARKPLERSNVADTVLDAEESTVLDLVDRLLNKGVMANGDVTLGVAGIDLIYVRLAALLCAADRVLPPDPNAVRKRSRHRQPGAAGPSAARRMGAIKGRPGVARTMKGFERGKTRS